MITLKNISPNTYNKALERAVKGGCTLGYELPDAGFYTVVSGENQYSVTIIKENGWVKASCTCESKFFCKHIALCCKAYKAYLVSRKACQECWQTPPLNEKACIDCEDGPTGDVVYKVVCVISPPKDVPVRSLRPEPTEAELAKIRAELFD